MVNDNENVYEVSSLNGRISVALSQLHASDRSNILHTLLSDKRFYDAVNDFAEELKLRKPGDKVESEFLDAFIVETIISQGIAEISPNDDEFTRDRKARRWFNKKLKKLLDEHKVPEKYGGLISEYVVLGDVNKISYVDGIEVSINKETNSLLLELSPNLTLTDFKKQIPAVFSYWNNRRDKVANPKYFSAKMDAALSRDKEDASYGKLADTDPRDVEAIKKAIERIRKKRKQLLSDTN